MTIDLGTLLGGIAAIIATTVFTIFGFIAKRHFARIDKMQESMEKLTEVMGRISNDVTNVMIMKGTFADIERCYHKFFDEKGEKATMWAKIDAAFKVAENHPPCELAVEMSKKLALLERENALLKEDIMRVRKREHWIGNKITLIVGAMDRAKIKEGTPGTDWTMPDWDQG